MVQPILLCALERLDRQIKSSLMRLRCREEEEEEEKESSFTKLELLRTYNLRVNKEIDVNISISSMRTADTNV